MKTNVVAKKAGLVAEAIEAEKTIIHISTLAKKPDMASPTFAKLLEPIQKALSGIVEIKDKSRGDPLFNHLSVVAEGVPALGWFTCVSIYKHARSRNNNLMFHFRNQRLSPLSAT